MNLGVLIEALLSVTKEQRKKYLINCSVTNGISITLRKQGGGIGRTGVAWQGTRSGICRGGSCSSSSSGCSSSSSGSSSSGSSGSSSNGSSIDIQIVLS